jgi:molybdenum storage protein
MTDPQPAEPTADAKHLASRLMAESLQSRSVLRGTDGPAVRALLPQVTVIKIGGQSIIDRGPDALLPVIAELGELSTEHALLITAGEGARARHAYDIATDLGLPTGMLATLGNSVSEQNASIISALMMDRGAVNVPMSLVPILLNGGLPVVMSGMPPNDWWEPPPRHGRVPERRTDTGTFLTAEAFGCRQVIYVKDQDGLYDSDPVTDPDARLILTISAPDLIARGLDSLPIEPIVLEMLIHARLVSQIQLINGLTPGAITRAVDGEPVGTMITAG